VADFSIGSSKVVFCTRDGSLRVKDREAPEQAVGTCLPRWPWTASFVGFAIPKNEHELTLFRDGVTLTIPFETGATTMFPKFSRTGLLVAVDAEGQGAFLRPGNSIF